MSQDAQRRTANSHLVQRRPLHLVSVGRSVVHPSSLQRKRERNENHGERERENKIIFCCLLSRWQVKVSDMSSTKQESVQRPTHTHPNICWNIQLFSKWTRASEMQIIYHFMFGVRIIAIALCWLHWQLSERKVIANLMMSISAWMSLIHVQKCAANKYDFSFIHRRRLVFRFASSLPCTTHSHSQTFQVGYFIRVQTNLTAEATNRTEHTNKIPLSFGFITTLTLVSASPKCRGFLDSFLCTLPTTNTNCNSSTMFNLCCGARRWLKQFEWMTHGRRACVCVSVCV